MQVKYKDFLYTIFQNDLFDTDYGYAKCEIRSSIAYGFGYKEMLEKFLNKAGFDNVSIKQILFSIEKNNFIILINNWLVKKLYGNKRYIDDSDLYGKLGNELIVEI